MKLAQRVSQVWNWLPAFRAVAESEHLPTASKEANLSASALSRAVKLLEDDLGVSLFVREGRNLELTTHGRRLLIAVRSATLAVESALDQVLSSEEGSGEVHIGAPGPYCALYVIPALRKLRETYPNLVPHLTSASGSLARAMEDGDLDIVLTENAEGAGSAHVTRLGPVTYSVYCGLDHPLAAGLTVTASDLSRYPFVVPPSELDDNWPPHLPRHVGMVVHQLHVAVMACAEDGFLAVLPDAVANGYRGDGALVRLPLEIIPERSLYAVWRQAAVQPKRIELVLSAIQQAFEDMRRGRPTSVPPARSTMRPPMWERSVLERAMRPPPVGVDPVEALESEPPREQKAR